MGIIADLSEWQGSIDFAQLKGQVDGVIIRVQHGYTHPDSRYKEYVTGCKTNGIPFGTYAYFAGVSVNDAIAEAKNALSLVDPESKCFAVDIEETCMTDLVAGGQTFIDTLKAAGLQNVGLYSYKGFYDAHNLAAIKADWHWIAGYGVNDGQTHQDPAVAGENLWQFTSVGHLQGISGNVDESKIVGDFPFFGNHTVVTTAKPIMVVKVLNETDVREDTAHTSGYVGNVHPGQMFNVWAHQGDWHYIIFDAEKGINGWVDGNGGKNLYWLDNPNLAKVYTVQAGDILSTIAKKLGTTVNELVTKNGLTDPNRIYPGQKLYI